MFLTLFLDGPKDMAKFMGAPSRRQNRVALREGGPEPEAVAAGAWRRRPCPEGPATAADGIVKSNKDLPNLDLVAEDNFVSFPFPLTLFSFPCICIFATVEFFSRLFLPSFSHSNILDARARKGREIQNVFAWDSEGRSLRGWRKVVWPIFLYFFPRKWLRTKSLLLREDDTSGPGHIGLPRPLYYWQIDPVTQ